MIHGAEVAAIGQCSLGKAKRANLRGGGGHDFFYFSFFDST
jgi:hypothetical protein